jgi:hypothetical protein
MDATRARRERCSLRRAWYGRWRTVRWRHRFGFFPVERERLAALTMQQLAQQRTA